MLSPIRVFLLAAALVPLTAGPLHARPRHGGSGGGTHPAARADDDKTTRFEMRHVNYHIDDTVVLQIDNLHGELLPAKPGVTPNFDDRDTLLLQIDGGEAAMSTASFATLMNRYVFNYRGTPLTDLRVSPEGDGLHITATLNHAIKTDMIGTLGAMPDGRIHFHPTTIRTAGIPTKGLMDAVGLKVDKLVKGTDTRGVDVAGDDLIMDLDRLLPPPRVHAHVTGIRVEGNRVAMSFGPTAQAGPDTPLTPPDASVPNYMYYKGGTVRFGKLTMVPTEMEFIDMHPEDAFDFSLAHYYDQIIAGYTKSNKDGALIAYVPDYRQIAEGANTPDLRPTPTPPPPPGEKKD